MRDADAAHSNYKCGAAMAIWQWAHFYSLSANNLTVRALRSHIKSQRCTGPSPGGRSKYHIHNRHLLDPRQEGAKAYAAK